MFPLPPVLPTIANGALAARASVSSPRQRTRAATPRNQKSRSSICHYICDAKSTYLFDLALKVLALDEVGDLVVVLALLVLGHGLVALGKLAEGGEGVGAELVEDAGDKLSELLVLGLAVDGKGVGGDRGVDCVAR